MSGIEIVILVGAGIYISKKVKENRERKRLAKETTFNAAHGVPQVVEPNHETARKRRSEDDEALPLYSPPTSKLEREGEVPDYDSVAGESSAAGVQRNQVAVEGEEDTLLPSYDDVAQTTSNSNASAQASSEPAADRPTSEKKKHRLSKPNFHFHGSSKSVDAAGAA